MHKIKRLSLIVFSLIVGLDVVSSNVFALQITYIGHSTVLIEASGMNILTDPFFGNQILGGLKRHIPPAYQVQKLPPIDLVLISHTHPDHFDLEAINKLTNKPNIVIPWARKKDLKGLDFTIIELEPWETYNQEKIRITAIPAKHMYGHCLGYIIEIEGCKIYFTGDTKLFPELFRLKDKKIDIMLLPFGGYPGVGSIWTTIQAIEAIKIVQPKIFVPIHWGTFKRWWTTKEPESPEILIEMAEKEAPDSRGKILNIGEKFLIPNGFTEGK